jgi:outer membrane protein TolC
LTTRATLLFFCLLTSGARAQYTLADAVRQAAETYPATTAAVQQAAAAAASVDLVRTAYLPRADLVAQANRSTRNNVFGMTLPQSTLPAISGPVLGTNTSGSAWGSAAGLQVAWEPFDFGLRRANVDAAQAGRRRADLAVASTRLESATAAGDAFLTVVAAERAAVAAEAGVNRSRVLVDVVGSLVRSDLRPGADLSRARAELAVSENILINARQGIETAKAALAQFVGGDARSLTVSAGALLEPPPEPQPAPAAPDHPRIAEQRAAMEQAQAARRAAGRSWYPRFNLQAVSYGRGTGAMTNGELLGGASGLGPNIFNWGAGLTVTFPAFDLPGIHARQRIEQHREAFEAARLDQVRRELKTAVETAQAQLQGARDVARNVPVQLEAARATELQALARYRAGLGTLVEVADAQRLVAQSEIDDALARLSVWRAMLRLAAAEGDLEPFLKRF